MLTVADRQFIQAHLDDDPARLLLAAHRYPGVQVSLAVAQLQALRKVRTKIPGWYRPDLIMPPPVSVEQASSEAAARFKAGLFAGQSMADLTGGMGVDTFFFARQFGAVTYVEQQPELVEAARHNFALLGATNIQCLNDTADAFLQASSGLLDLIYLDPARRDDRMGRVFQLEDCQPNVLEMKARLLAAAKRVLLKTAPLFDLHRAVKQLGAVSHIWVVSVGHECKEVLYLLEPQHPLPDDIPIEAVGLGGSGDYTFRFTWREEGAPAAPYSVPMRFLYEPEAALLKAGAFQAFARRFGLAKLHPNTHLYTSEEFRPQVPGRSFRIEAVLRYDRKAVRGLIPDGRANITVRNFPDPVARIRQKLGLADGGEWYLFAATDAAHRKILLACRRLLDRGGEDPTSLPA